MTHNRIKIIILLVCISIAISAYAAENYFFTNFTAGVITRKLDARIDFPKYLDGARTIENMIIFPQGGVYKRPGTYYVSGVSNNATTVRLIPFEYSTEQTYILEFGDYYIRFYKDRGQIMNGASPYEITTTYTADEAQDIQYVQSADYLYLAHSGHTPAKLTRSGHTSWTLTDITFYSPPTDDQLFYPAGGVTLAATSGSGVTFTSIASTFLAGDVGRNIEISTGRAIITSLVDSANVVCDIISSFSGTTALTTEWYMAGSPTGTLTPDAYYPEGAIATLTGNQDMFRSTDIGDYIFINNGLYQITAYTSATIVKGEILNQPDNAAASATWTLEGNVWNATDGYPTTVEFFEERLVWAGTTNYPQTIWLSKTGDYENFATGSDDDDAMAVTIASGKVNSIQWLKSGQALSIGTTGSEWTLGALTSTEALTPTNVQLKEHTNHGSSKIMPVKVGRNTLYVQRHGKKLREFGYDWEVEGYISPDLTILAENLTENTTIKQLAYQQEPWGIIWTLLNDGDLLSLTYLKDQNVYAWSKHTTQGIIESIACISGDTSDELWMETKRTIGGSDYRFIEYMKDLETEQMKYAFYVDSGLTYNGAGTTSFTGLDHLAGTSVSVLANGAYEGDFTVSSGGTIEITTSATNAAAGVSYAAILETVDIPQGSGLIRRITNIIPRFYKTAHVQYGTGVTDAYELDWTNQGVTPYTGNVDLPILSGWKNNQPVYMQSDEPLPLGISGILVQFE